MVTSHCGGEAHLERGEWLLADPHSRRRYPDGTMGILHRYRMSGDADAIALLSWSPWTLTTVKGRTLALACLAVADSQGRVWSTEVTQVVTSPHVGFAATAGSVIPDEDPADVWAIQPLLICESDRRPATQFRWISRGTIVSWWLFAAQFEADSPNSPNSSTPRLER